MALTCRCSACTHTGAQSAFSLNPEVSSLQLQVVSLGIEPTQGRQDPTTGQSDAHISEGVACLSGRECRGGRSRLRSAEKGSKDEGKLVVELDRRGGNGH